MYYYITNAMGDVISIIDENGNTVVDYCYDGWGNVVDNVANTALTTDFAMVNPMLYRSYYYDEDLGVYYLQSRYYKADWCRFINSDLPIYAQLQKDEYTGLNLFSYCGNEPIRQNDFTGQIPNMIIVDWKASAQKIFIYVKNIGADTVDSFSGTVKVTNGTSKKFSKYRIKPFKTTTITVSLNMTQCKEEITVSFYAVDGGREFGRGKSSGGREIPSNLSSLWGKGSFDSVYTSINRHYSKHHLEVSTNNIVDYATKAKNYRSSVLYDIKHLSKSELNAKYTITNSNGFTPAKKYKHKTNKQFIILSNNGYKILSYGK